MTHTCSHVPCGERLILVHNLVFLIPSNVYVDDIFAVFWRKLIKLAGNLSSLYLKAVGRLEATEKHQDIDEIQQSIVHLGI